MTYSAIIASPLGKLGIVATDEALKRIDFLPSSTALLPADRQYAQEICHQLRQYFADPHYPFTLKLDYQGTLFQQNVWQTLLAIPAGTAMSYGQIAEKLATSPRAVGNACRSNQIPIIIPCHRVIAQNGMGGYSGNTQGEMMQIKNWLLRHENYMTDSKLDFARRMKNS